jgi:hypothetical protein
MEPLANHVSNMPLKSHIGYADLPDENCHSGRVPFVGQTQPGLQLHAQFDPGCPRYCKALTPTYA